MKNRRREARASFGTDEATLHSYFHGIVQSIVNEISALYALGVNTNIIGYQDHDVIEKEDKSGWDILIRMEYVTPLTKYYRKEAVVQRRSAAHRHRYMHGAGALL